MLRKKKELSIFIPEGWIDAEWYKEKANKYELDIKELKEELTDVLEADDLILVEGGENCRTFK